MLIKKRHIKQDLLKNIPKILHLYWDRSPISCLQVLTATTFHKHNPDWEIRLYLPKQDYTGTAKYIPKYVGQDFFYMFEEMDYVNIIEVDLKEFGIREDLHNILRSDILRYNMLYKHGGVWSDFDVLWLKPLDCMNNIRHVNILNHVGMTACLYQNIVGHYNIGILLSIKGHPFYKQLLDQIRIIQKTPNKFRSLYDIKTNKFYHQSFGVVLWKQLFPRLNNITNKYKDCLGIRYKTFYPYSIFELDKLYKKNDISVIDKDVVCVHWFNGHELSKTYINEEQYNKECSMTTILNTML